MRKTINAPPPNFIFPTKFAIPQKFRSWISARKNILPRGGLSGFRPSSCLQHQQVSPTDQSALTNKKYCKKTVPAISTSSTNRFITLRHSDWATENPPFWWSLPGKETDFHCFVSLKECSLDFLHAISRPAPPKSAWLKPNTWWNQPHHWSQFLCGRRQLYKKGPPNYYKWIYP